MEVTFAATRKNCDPTHRELYEMDFLLRMLGLKRAFLDLGLLTVAACTPKGIDVHLADEYIAPFDYDRPTDLVALSAKTSCVDRVYAVAKEYRRRGKTVILGGIHATLRPEEALEHVDCIVTGEAENLWPQVLRDAEAGQLKTRYDAHEFPPMAGIPVPRWPSGAGRKYLFHQLQTTRGCPFQCRFCSVPDISGQAFRFKPVDHVLHEITQLPQKGASALLPHRPLYIVDDNFISRTRYTRELLTAMVPLHQAGQIPPWSAETTLNVAQDEELLDLFQAAGCETLIIGIESINEATLQAMDKGINFCMTYQEAIERIHARGMSVVGNFIVGFDTDTTSVFQNTLDFIQKTGILFPFFSILTPMPGTALFDDTLAAGRIDHTDWSRYDTRHVVFEPAQMRRDELMDGYIWLYEQTYGTDLMLDRMERQWRRSKTARAGWLEGAFLAARLAPTMLGDSEFRSLARPGLRMMRNRHLASNPGSLLSLLDSYDFARFMRQFRTDRWAENVQTFSGRSPTVHGIEPAARQWDNDKAVRRTHRLRDNKEQPSSPA